MLSGMSQSLKERVRAKLMRQLTEDGPLDLDQDDIRQLSVQDDLVLLSAVEEDDPLVEELAARYLVP